MITISSLLLLKKSTVLLDFCCDEMLVSGLDFSVHYHSRLSIDKEEVIARRRKNDCTGHANGASVVLATGSSWPAALIGILNLNGSSMMAKEPFNSIRITALAAYPVA